MSRTVHRSRVAIVEDHMLFAESLDLALTLEGHQVDRIELPEHARPAGLLLSWVLRSHPRIVLLDLDLGPHGDGLRLVTPLATAGVAVVVITAESDRARWGECLLHGARTVLDKAVPLNTILATMRHIGDGRAVLTREARQDLIRHFHEEKHELREIRARLARLTSREAEVLGHLMQGTNVREIARISVVSEATVRTQVKSILAKLEVSSQLAAVGAAHGVLWRPPHHSVA